MARYARASRALRERNFVSLSTNCPTISHPHAVPEAYASGTHALTRESVFGKATPFRDPFPLARYAVRTNCPLLTAKLAPLRPAHALNPPSRGLGLRRVFLRGRPFYPFRFARVLPFFSRLPFCGVFPCFFASSRPAHPRPAPCYSLSPRRPRLCGAVVARPGRLAVPVGVSFSGRFPHTQGAGYAVQTTAP